MIFKQTWVNVTDNTNVKWLQIFHLYKGFNRRHAGVGYFIKGTARVVEPPRLEYKGFKVKFNRKGDICRGLVVRTAYRVWRMDGTSTYLGDNSIILIKKKQELKSKYFYGPVSFKVKRKRFLNLFSIIV